ncbi:MAG: L-iditol 2-dehydrogenase [Frankiales bacterium]|jgi:2-desacetyl-2-hydroxyethyl bacteriochlorophyllide A dehydrogenase|nr:L-iditol 2-dehydrogenase [Frankiales bacterium]
MRAAVYKGPRQIEVREIPTPALAPDELLVEIDYCGVCGSDLHFVIEGWSAPGRVHGHEWSGRVVALGADVDEWSIGDRVVGGPTPCGECALCQAGRTSLCRQAGIQGDDDYESTGAYAQFHKTVARRVHRVPDGLSQRAAALAEPLAVAIHGITRSKARPGHRVLVTGGGPIGLLTVAALCAYGIDDITVSEPAAARRDRALRVGASRAVDPSELPAGPAMPMQVTDEPYDAAIECSGRAVAMEAALSLLGPAGTLVLSGTSMEKPRWDPLRILLLELEVTGAYEYDDGGFSAALDLLASGRLPIDELAEPDDTPLDGLLAAMEGLVAGTITRKVMVTPT